MSADAKKYYASALALLALSLIALYGGMRWLPLLIPAAALVWFAVAPGWRRGRN